MKLIDTNALIILILGLMNPKYISNHKRTSIYEEQDFYDLVAFVGDFQKLIVLPNVWTEVDNLLNNFSGNQKIDYIENIVNTLKLTTEIYIKSETAVEGYGFYDLGLTDSLLLSHSKKCEVLITSDSQLSDYALANGVLVYDLVKNRNDRLLNS